MMQDWIKIFIVPVVCLVVFAIVLSLYVNPQHVKIRDMENQLDVLHGKGDKMVPEAKILAQETIVDSLQQAVKDLKDRLYPVAEFSDLGKAIANSVRRFNLQLMTLTPDYSKLNLIQQEGQEITELPITINMTGKFMQFAHYLETLSDFPYVKATEVNLRRSKETSNDVVIEIKGVVIFKNKVNQESGQDQKVLAKQI
ncbi:MAG: type 4a pilus biogenesis protein PilO [Bacteroidales bacterium]|nr:type 4a pilus biogenesis protein PilO [Bacteroidales bacterium]